MLKKITSIEEIQQDDLLVTGASPQEDKQYKIKNIGNGHVYAISVNGMIDLKVITAYSLLFESWWKKEKT